MEDNEMAAKNAKKPARRIRNQKNLTGGKRPAVAPTLWRGDENREGIIGREEAQESKRGPAATKDELPQKNTENAKEGKELDFNRREPERTEKEPIAAKMREEPKGKNLSRITRFHAIALQKGKIFLDVRDSVPRRCNSRRVFAPFALQYTEATQFREDFLQKETKETKLGSGVSSFVLFVCFCPNPLFDCGWAAVGLLRGCPIFPAINLFQGNLRGQT